MRVAYLVNQYPLISHVFIRREILALERKGIEVVRIALRGWVGALVDAEDELERKRTRYVLRDGALALLWALFRVLLTRPRSAMHALALVWRTGRRAERPLSLHLIYLAEACRIMLWLRSTDVEHLHVHFGTNPAQVAMIIHALGGPPWSFTVHGPIEFDNVQPYRLAEKVRDSKFVVAVSSYGQSQLCRLVEHRYWPKIRVVRCGLEATFGAEPVNPPPSSRRLVCVGRLTEQKGQLLLVEAARQLASRGTDFKLVLVGDGEMRAEIEGLVARYKLENHISITGHVTSERLSEEMLAARALVLPSFAEGLPMVIMEAMALRRPVISTFVAGIPELVLPGENGWLVPAGDVTALAEAMRTCLDAPIGELARMGDAARERVLKRHDVDVQASQLADLFRHENYA